MAKRQDGRAAITHDALLGGRLWLSQPEKGHRAGTDAVLLAAFCSAKAGEGAVDLGAGVGTVGLCLATRVQLGALHLVEKVPELASLAAQNARGSGLPNVHVHCADVAARMAALKEAGLRRDYYDHALFNPPFHDARRNQSSPDERRALAHMGDEDVLAAWLKTALTLCHAKGEVSFIHRADRLAMILSVIGNRLGALRVVPVAPKPDAPALRVLVAGQKGSRAPLRLLPPLVVADENGVHSAETNRILRDGASLER